LLLFFIRLSDLSDWGKHPIAHGNKSGFSLSMKDKSGNGHAAQPAGESAGAQNQPHFGPRRRILVVDDDWEVRRVNSEVLIEFGYQVDTAEDGVAAWTRLQFSEYDLLVTNHDMPRVTGFELLHRMRAANMTLPVIFATNSFPKEDFARLPSLQPAITLIQPYTADEFLETVKEVLRATDEARAVPAAGKLARPVRLR
jgi:CheY-like chemotaxis protein